MSSSLLSSFLSLGSYMTWENFLTSLEKWPLQNSPNNHHAVVCVYKVLIYFLFLLMFFLIPSLMAVVFFLGQSSVVLVSGLFTCCVLAWSALLSDFQVTKLLPLSSALSLISSEKKSTHITQVCLIFSHLAKYLAVVLYPIALFYVLILFIDIWSHMFYFFSYLFLVSPLYLWLGFLFYIEEGWLIVGGP